MIEPHLTLLPCVIDTSVDPIISIVWSHKLMQLDSQFVCIVSTFSLVERWLACLARGESLGLRVGGLEVGIGMDIQIVTKTFLIYNFKTSW